MIVLPGHPTIGAYLAKHDSEITFRRVTARWRMRMQLLDLHTRAQVLQQLGELYDAVRLARRLDIVANDLRALAELCDVAVQAYAVDGRRTIRDESAA